METRKDAKGESRRNSILRLNGISRYILVVLLLHVTPPFVLRTLIVVCVTYVYQQTISQTKVCSRFTVHFEDDTPHNVNSFIISCYAINAYLNFMLAFFHQVSNIAMLLCCWEIFAVILL